MADVKAEVFDTVTRVTRGTRHARRQRAAGKVPAILYGHGEANVALTIPAEQVDALLRHGGKVVTLRGAVAETALIREVQWDPFGQRVLHMDLTRVDAGELVKTTIAIELRGDAPGVREGGLLEQVLHELEIECPVSQIPDKLLVRINDLHLPGAITAGDVVLPSGARLLIDPAEIVVHCVHRVDVDEDAKVPTEGAEPEVIGRKPAEDEEGEE